jgi:hypothetical protein
MSRPSSSTNSLTGPAAGGYVRLSKGPKPTGDCPTSNLRCRSLDIRPQNSSTEGSSDESFTEDSSTESSGTSPEPDSFPLICEETRCVFCIGKPGVSTFSRPAKMMDHVESHLRKQPAEIIACCHPVCMAEGLVLNNVARFKNHVQLVHSITLRKPKNIF